MASTHVRPNSHQEDSGTSSKVSIPQSPEPSRLAPGSHLTEANDKADFETLGLTGEWVITKSAVAPLQERVRIASLAANMLVRESEDIQDNVHPRNPHITMRASIEDGRAGQKGIETF